MMIRRPRGTQDFVPGEVEKFQYVESKAREIAARFMFSEIRTPIFEDTQLFVRGVGTETDVVKKEMYTFTSRSDGTDGGSSLTLRPEGTSPTVRALIENSLIENGKNRLYYLASIFRHENPQMGRYRQHHQFGVELFGEAAPTADAEIIALAVSYLQALGLSNLVVRLNSIGCSVCRPEHKKELVAYYEAHRAELCPDCQVRLERNPLRLLDCKVPQDHKLALLAPKTTQFLCSDCDLHFSSLQNYLQALGITYELDSAIVRGLDYYTRTVFEIVYAGLGAQATVCGGGRYDLLVETIGGKPTAGIGFGLGLERLVLTLEKEGLFLPEPISPDFYLVCLTEEGLPESMRLVRKLRDAGKRVEFSLEVKSLKAQMRQADKRKAHYVGILGAKELQEGTIAIKDMQTGQQQTTVQDHLLLSLI